MQPPSARRAGSYGLFVRDINHLNERLDSLQQRTIPAAPIQETKPAPGPASTKRNSMAPQHKDITIVSAEPAGKGIIIHFSDGTTTLFQSHFLYEVRDQDGNVALTDLSDDELMQGFNE